MEYQKYFDISGEPPQKQFRQPTPTTGGRNSALGDRRDGQVYVYNDKIELAINVALATGRPMLVRGPSGSGKSSLARNIAARLSWRYYEQVITSRTQARDLLWVFDSLRRLGDAQARRLDKDPAHYIEPGVLWWAFDAASAGRRGRSEQNKDDTIREIKDPADDPGIGPDNAGAVILLDEIDKADPDVPNNLLVPLGSFEFRVRETGASVAATRPLLCIITTNDERVLPTAFMRRCIVLELEPPDEALLIKIAKEHYGPDKQNLYQPIAESVVKISTAAASPVRGAAGQQPAPSTAEYLDTVRACLDLGISPVADDERWQVLTKATLAKRASLT
ncbi:MAG: AAA family ATPase [Pyrinomonadaceae bacterium]